MSGRTVWQRLREVPEIDVWMAVIHALVIASATLNITLFAISIFYFHDLPAADWTQVMSWGGIFVMLLIINGQAWSLFGVLRRIYDNLRPESPPRTRGGRARGRESGPASQAGLGPQ